MEQRHRKGGREADLPSLSLVMSLVHYVSHVLTLAVFVTVCLPYYAFTKKAWLGRILGMSGVKHQSKVISGQADATKRTFLCIGDSLTEGALSFDWVGQLQKLYPSIRFINAGVCGQVSEGAVNGLDTLLDTYPDYAAASLLIGTNDVHATLSRQMAKVLNVQNKLKEGGPVYSEDAYAGNVDSMLKTLRRRSPKAGLLLLTMPPLGENLDSDVNAQVCDYNARLKAVAEKNGATLLDFHAECVRAIRQARPDGKRRPAPVFTSAYFFVTTIKSVLLAIAYDGSWGKVASQLGNTVLIDGIHLSDVGGGLLLGLLRPFLEKTLVPEH